MTSPLPPDDATGSRSARTWLDELPKVELHVHLEGSISADTATRLAIAHDEDPASALGLEGGDYPRRYRDFNHFVDVFVATSRQVRSRDDLAMVAREFALSQAAQSVRWTEATFTAHTLVEQGLQPDQMWDAIREGFDAVDGVAIGLIIDTVRELGPPAARRTLELVADANAPIVALGLTGIEGSVAEREFALLRTGADDLGLGLVVHAGETGTADNVRAALDDLGADRIGHGIAASRDPQLMARLAEEGTILEVCPSSNVTLGLVPSLEDHPLAQLIDAGVAVTINSDDPPFFSTTLTGELAHAMRLANLTPADIIALQRRAITASFAPDTVKQQVLDELGFADPAPASAGLR
ncbi:MAG: adenosine deaminase [Nitriliruptoraceae bacterium]